MDRKPRNMLNVVSMLGKDKTLARGCSRFPYQTLAGQNSLAAEDIFTDFLWREYSPPANKGQHAAEANQAKALSLARLKVAHLGAADNAPGQPGPLSAIHALLFRPSSPSSSRMAQRSLSVEALSRAALKYCPESKGYR